MCSIKLMIFVSLCLIRRVESSDPVIITINRSTANSASKIFDLVENDTINLIVENLNEQILKPKCSGSCDVNNNKISDLSCQVVHGSQRQYLNVSIKHNITKNLSGEWKCDFAVKRSYPNIREVNIPSHFQLNVTTTNKAETLLSIDQNTLMYIGFGILGVVVILVLIIQTYCIIRYKRKANAIKRDAQWHKNKDSNENTSSNTVRYSKMPGLQKDKVLIPESRDSVIYEDLEAIKNKIPPMPPSVESLPRKKKAKVLGPPVPASEIPTPASATDSPAPSPVWSWNSLLKRKIKKYEETESESNSSTLDKRTTLDRIKERPPEPLPKEGDIYEDMSESPQPAKKHPIINNTKEKLQHPKPKPAMAPPTKIANVAPPLNSQLKQAVERRNCLNPVQLQPKPLPKKTLSKPLPKEPITENTIPTLKKPIQKHNESTLPKTKEWAKQEPTTPKGWQKEPLATKDWSKEPTTTKDWSKEPTTTKDWSNEPTTTKDWSKEPTTTKDWSKEPTTTKDWSREPTKTKTWQKESIKTKSSSKPKHWPREDTSQEQEPARVKVSQRPKLTPYNPGLPPPDAPPTKITPWGESIVKPKPPPSMKPKQLYPLPDPPSKPESLPQDHDRDSDDSESEWNYEPLSQYNIYSI